MNWSKQRAISRLEVSIQEAERFLKRAKKAKQKIETGDEDCYCSRSFAAAKRASLDLTVELVNLRRRDNWIVEPITLE